MAIGMKMGRTDSEDRETQAKVYEKCQAFWDRFEKEFGGRDCYKLSGYHLDDPEENKQWLASGGREKCTAIVERTAWVLCESLNEIK